MTQQTVSYSLQNYLVPSDGVTHGVRVTITATATPVLIDWKQISTEYQTPFTPQGVYIDASNAGSDISLDIQPVGLTLKAAQGTIQAFSYPASRQNQTVAVSGSGSVTLIFVDYPVLPSTLYGGAGTQDVNVTNAELQVQGQALATGNVPYQIDNQPRILEVKNGNDSQTVTLAGDANNPNLRRLNWSLSNDATLAAAAQNVLTITANGTTIYNESVFIPAAADTTPGINYRGELVFGDCAIANDGGNIVVELATALATGALYASAYLSE